MNFSALMMCVLFKATLIASEVSPLRSQWSCHKISRVKWLWGAHTHNLVIEVHNSTVIVHTPINWPNPLSLERCLVCIRDVGPTNAGHFSLDNCIASSFCGGTFLNYFKIYFSGENVH